MLCEFKTLLKIYKNLCEGVLAELSWLASFYWLYLTYHIISIYSPHILSFMSVYVRGGACLSIYWFFLPSHLSLCGLLPIFRYPTLLIFTPADNKFSNTHHLHGENGMRIFMVFFADVCSSVHNKDMCERECVWRWFCQKRKIN